MKKDGQDLLWANSASDVRATELELRKKLIQDRAVDVMIAVGSNFFYTVTLPCTLWFIDKAKAKLPPCQPSPLTPLQEVEGYSETKYQGTSCPFGRGKDECHFSNKGYKSSGGKTEALREMIQEELRIDKVCHDKYGRAVANVYKSRESVNKKMQKKLKQ